MDYPCEDEDNDGHEGIDGHDEDDDEVRSRSVYDSSDSSFDYRDMDSDEIQDMQIARPDKYKKFFCRPSRPPPHLL